MSNKIKNQNRKLPTSQYFTIKDLFSLNPTEKEITMRVYLTKCIEGGLVSEIGYIPGGKGRPVKVFSQTPITKTLLDKAEADGISLVSKARELLLGSVNLNKPSSGFVNSQLNMSPQAIVQ